MILLNPGCYSFKRRKLAYCSILRPLGIIRLYYCNNVAIIAWPAVPMRACIIGWYRNCRCIRCLCYGARCEWCCCDLSSHSFIVLLYMYVKVIRILLILSSYDCECVVCILFTMFIWLWMFKHKTLMLCCLCTM